MNIKSLVPSTSALVDTTIAAGSGAAGYFAAQGAANLLPTKAGEFVNTQTGQVVVLAAAAVGHATVKGTGMVNKALKGFLAGVAIHQAAKLGKQLVDKYISPSETVDESGKTTGLGYVAGFLSDGSVPARGSNSLGYVNSIPTIPAGVTNSLGA